MFLKYVHHFIHLRRKKMTQIITLIQTIIHKMIQKMTLFQIIIYKIKQLITLIIIQ